MEDKKKLEQIILIIIIPICIFGLLRMRLRGREGPVGSHKEARLKAESGKVQALVGNDTIDAIPRPAGVLDVEYKGSDKDPLGDLLQVHLYKLKLEEKTKPKEPEKGMTTPLPELNIGGLIWSTGMPQAIVNGKVIKAGDTIAGVKVVKIEKEGLTVIHQGETVFVPKK